jgi:hypothetical protein
MGRGRTEVSNEERAGSSLHGDAGMSRPFHFEALGPDVTQGVLAFVSSRSSSAARRGDPDGDGSVVVGINSTGLRMQ